MASTSVDPSSEPGGRLYRVFRSDVAGARLPPGPGDEAPVTGDDVRGLDEPVQRYLRFLDVVGRPRVWSFRVRFAGRFRLKPGGPWMPAEAWQYNSAIDIARVFTMRIRVAGIVPMIGHDTYLRGTGRMHGKVLGLVTVADGSGTEFDIGELSTWLNDAVLLAPSMLLDGRATWTAVDDHAFEVGMSDAGNDVRATVTIDDRGAPIDFVTTDRWCALPGGLVQARWRTPVPVWELAGGRPFPGPSQVTWDLPDGPFTYIEGGFVPGSLSCNLTPPAGGAA